MTKKKITVRKDRKTDLTLKQRKWIKHYLRTGNASLAARKAYNCTKESAGSIGYENLIKLQDPVRALMEAKGISLGRLLEVLDDGLKADRVISAIKGKEATGVTKDFIEIPDHKTRHKYMETAGKWLGVEGKKASDVAISKSQFNFFSISREKRDEFNKKFAEFVRSGAIDTKEFVPEGGVEE